MNAKILPILFSAAILGSCATAYKTGQTPDDVYYSPAKFVEEKKQDRTETKKADREDIEIRMCAYDRRWRSFDEDYSYISSPYHHYTCGCSNYSYYYNPYYNIWPVYTTKISPVVNTTPRMVNLNGYTGYNNTAVANPKTGTGIIWVTPPGRYNNSNRSGFNNFIRQVFSGNSGSNSSSSSNTRTYSPSTTGSGSSSSGSNNSSGKVSRPGRG